MIGKLLGKAIAAPITIPVNAIKEAEKSIGKALKG